MSNLRARRLHLHGTALVGCLCTVLWGGTAFAQAQTYSFDIPSEPLSIALRDYARVSGQQIIFTDDLVVGKRAPALHGTYSADDALTHLLTGSTLVVERSPSGAIMVRPKNAEAASNEGAANTNGGVETVTVTGTRIPTDTRENAVPVRHYSRQDIDQSGRTAVADFLNTLPDVSTSINENGFQTFAGQTTVRLHGLPNGTTLVLIDGQRIEAGYTGFFDLSNIPLAAVDRIDVVPVGSSAVYGSDGLAGAVNVVLRRNYDGLEANASYGAASGTDETNLDAAFGRNWDRGSIFVAANYQGRSELLGAERAATRNTLTPSGTVSPFSSDSCDPGSVYSLNGQNLPGLNSTLAGIPASSNGMLSVQDFTATAGRPNLCNSAMFAALIPASTRFGILSAGRYAITDSVELFAEILYSRETLDARVGNFITLYGGSYGAFTVSASNPYNPFGQTIGISYAFPGIEESYNNTQSFIRPTVGVRGALIGGWNFEARAFYSADQSYISLRYADPVAVQAALNSSDPATALNPFVSGSSSPALPSEILSLEASAQHVATKFYNKQQGGQVVIRGPLFSLPAGNVETVIGAEYIVDNQRTLLYAGAPQIDLTRNSYALFTEGRIPLLSGVHTGDEEQLVLTVAGRYDHSSDFGGKPTWQAGIEWRPTSTLLPRAAYATSYKAPLLQQISGGTTASYTQSVVDPFRGNQNVIVPVVQGSNPDLHPETGRSQTLGLVYTSEAVPGFRANVTWFSIDIANHIGTLASQVLVDNPTLFPSAVVRAPASPQDIAQGFLGPISQINNLYFNFGDLDVAGLDFDAAYTMDTEFGQITPSASFTYTYKWRSALTPGSPSANYVSRATLFGAGFAPRWKGTLGMDWTEGPYSAHVSGRYVGPYLDYQDFIANTHELGDFWFVDANVKVGIGELLASDNGYLNSTYVEVGGTNLFDELPQVSFSYQTFDPAESDIRGRFLYARIGVKL